MEIKEIEMEGHNVKFVNEWQNRRNGFTHKTTLFINNKYMGEAKCHYINRTWECYTYQTSMLNACHNFIKDREDITKDNIKRLHNKSRMTKALKSEYEKEIKQDEYIQLMEKVIAIIN